MKIARWAIVTAAIALYGLGTDGVAIAGLVSWWDLNENTGNTANDSAGVNNAATLGNSAMWESVGVGVVGSRDFGSALRFDSNSDTFAHNLALPKTRGTISMWVKPDAWTVPENIRRQVFYYESNGTDEKYNGFGYNTTSEPVLEIHTGLRNIDGKAQFYVSYQDGLSNTGQDQGSGRVVLGSQLLDYEEIDGNTWFNMIVSWTREPSADDPSLVMYLNGDRHNWTHVDGTPKDWEEYTPSVMKIGQPAHAGTTDRFYSGLMDDIGVWDWKITDESAAAIYGGTRLDENIVPNPEPSSLVLCAASGLAFWRRWKRRSAKGDEVADGEGDAA